MCGAGLSENPFSTACPAAPHLAVESANLEAVYQGEWGGRCGGGTRMRRVCTVGECEREPVLPCVPRCTYPFLV